MKSIDEVKLVDFFLIGTGCFILGWQFGSLVGLGIFFVAMGVQENAIRRDK